jgi:hypothetical protein
MVKMENSILSVRVMRHDDEITLTRVSESSYVVKGREEVRNENIYHH